MEYNFVINPEIEKICEQKAKEEYELAKQIEARWPRKTVDKDFIIQRVKEEIYHRGLILKPRNVNMSEFADPKSEVKRAWYDLRAKYAEEAVNKVMEEN